MFKEHCLFCGKHVQNDCHKRGVDAYQVQTGDFQTFIKKVCQERGDNWSQIVMGRIPSRL